MTLFVRAVYAPDVPRQDLLVLNCEERLSKYVLLCQLFRFAPLRLPSPPLFASTGTNTGLRFTQFAFMHFHHHTCVCRAVKRLGEGMERTKTMVVVDKFHSFAEVGVKHMSAVGVRRRNSLLICTRLHLCKLALLLFACFCHHLCLPSAPAFARMEEFASLNSLAGIFLTLHSLF